MTNYTVIAYREVTERAFIDIEAESPDAAKKIFYENYDKGEYDNEFSFDDEQIQICVTEG